MDKKYANYTIQKIPREIWIKFKVILAKRSLLASRIFRAFIKEYVEKSKDG